MTVNYKCVQMLDYLRVKVDKIIQTFEPNKKLAVELALEKEVNWIFF